MIFLVSNKTFGRVLQGACQARATSEQLCALSSKFFFFLKQILKFIKNFKTGWQSVQLGSSVPNAATLLPAVPLVAFAFPASKPVGGGASLPSPSHATVGWKYKARFLSPHLCWRGGSHPLHHPTVHASVLWPQVR